MNTFPINIKILNKPLKEKDGYQKFDLVHPL